MTRNTKMWILIAVLGFASTAWARGSRPNPQELIQQHEQAFREAEAHYREAVLKHGIASNETLEAMNKLDAAENQLEVTRIRVQQLQALNSPTSSTSTFPSGAAQ